MTDEPLYSERLITALGVAARLHARQRRKGSEIPYLSHLLGTCAIALDYGAGEDEAIAALLHDALEDQWERTSPDEIRGRFGDKVVRIVVACSDSLGGEKREWRARKSNYLAHLADQPDEVLRVSLADKLHNARAIVADLRTEGDAVWDRFTGPPPDQAWYYMSLAEIFRGRRVSSLVDEFAVVVADLVARARRAPSRDA